MSRRSISIDEKIKKQKEVVGSAKDKYDAELNELNLLIKKKQDLQGKELLAKPVEEKWCHRCKAMCDDGENIDLK